MAAPSLTPLPGPAGWPTTQPAPPLLPATVHVWLADLDQPVDLAPLAPDEQARAARFLAPIDAARFRAARATLRHLLAAYTARPAASLRFTLGPHGKPGLAHAPHFNLSHSGPQALVAVTDAGPVGIDLEQPRPLPNHAALARRTFAPAETAALEALPPEHRLPAFFRCWTRKEAIVKALGAGITIPLDSFTVPIAPDPGPTQVHGPWPNPILLLPLATPSAPAALALHAPHPIQVERYRL